MKHCLVVSPYWDSFGGGERYVASFISLLLKNGYSVDVLWPQDVSQRLKSRFGIDLQSARWLDHKYSPILSINYDLLFWVSDGSLPISFSRKTIIHMQFPFTHTNGSSIVNQIKAGFYTFVVNSHFTKSFIDAEYQVDSQVIHPPVDTTQFVAKAKQKLIIYVGRFSQLTQSKGQHYLIDAFKKLSSDFTDWRLVIAGGADVGTSGSYMELLKSKSAGAAIDIITNPSFTQLKQLYSKAQLFWSAAGFGFSDLSEPTKVEHFGISLVEAMSAGCVPLVSRLGGHKEIIDDGKNGLMWDSLENLVKDTRRLLSNPSQIKLLSSAAMEKSKMFSTAEFNQRFLKLIL